MCVVKLIVKSIIEYDLSGKTQVEVTRILRVLYGFTDKSNFGKYEYRRKGVISGFQNARQIKNVILVESGEAPELLRVLKKLKVKPKVLDLS